MKSITVRLDDTKAEALRQRAKRYGLDPAEFVQASIEHLLGQPDGDFEKAMQRVLSKNHDLYERLA